LSPRDEPGEVNEKCRNYKKCGIGHIYVFDPEKRTAEIWMADRLVAIEMLRLPNGVTSPVSAIWTELDRRMA
jgi:Uma2 family endonuclease